MSWDMAWVFGFGLLIGSFVNVLIHRLPRMVMAEHTVNDDVPLYDLARRFLAPLGRYRRLVDPEPEPLHEDDELLVLGVSTARSAASR